MFENRTDAGEELADLMSGHEVEVDLVLSIARGGLPVARQVADELDVPLDVLVAEKIAAPEGAEQPVGAVASDGTLWVDEEAVDEFGVDETYLEDQREEQRAIAERKLEQYRGEPSAPDVDGKAVLIVDDGVTTGAVAKVCIEQVRAAGAERVVFAVPVAPEASVESLMTYADEVVPGETPPHFQRVEQFYDEFDEITDDEARSYLE